MFCLFCPGTESHSKPACVMKLWLRLHLFEMLQLFYCKKKRSTCKCILGSFSSSHDTYIFISCVCACSVPRTDLHGHDCMWQWLSTCVFYRIHCDSRDCQHFIADSIVDIWKPSVYQCLVRGTHKDEMNCRIKVCPLASAHSRKGAFISDLLLANRFQERCLRPTRICFTWDFTQSTEREQMCATIRQVGGLGLVETG